MTDKDNFDALNRLHTSTNIAVVDLERQNAALKLENTILGTNLVNCQKALDINKLIMRNALTEQNSMKDSFTLEIQDLKAKIKRMLENDHD
jgi:hypothetical protein